MGRTRSNPCFSSIEMLPLRSCPLDAREYKRCQRVVIEMDRLEELSRAICPNRCGEALPEPSDAWRNVHGRHLHPIPSVPGLHVFEIEL